MNYSNFQYAIIIIIIIIRSNTCGLQKAFSQWAVFWEGLQCPNVVSKFASESPSNFQINIIQKVKKK